MLKSKKNKANMQSFLFKSYMGAMLLVLIGVTAFFAYLQFNTINHNIISSIQQTSTAVGESVDNQIEVMNTISVNALYSNLLRDSFSEYLSLQNYTDDTQKQETAYLQNNNAKILHDIMFAVIGANYDVRQLNLYNVDSGGFGTGLYNGYIDTNVNTLLWYEKTLEKHGYFYISGPTQNPELSTSAQINTNTYYLSLCRLYFDRYNQIDGAIEVVQYYDTVFDAAANPNSTYQPSIYFYSNDGILLYPIIQEGTECFDYYSQYNGHDSVAMLQNTVTNQNEYVCFEKLDSSDFLAVTVVNSKSFYAPMYNFLVTMLVVLVGVTVLCYFFARRLTKRLSSPLVGMYSYLSKMDFNNLIWQDMDVPESNIIEINELRKGINLFQQKLKSSMDNIMLLQQHEAQSQMLALQSQMNPHFLYNSLSTIIAMAEENMTESINEMCIAITGILRYISSNDESMVSLEVELENTDRYISCLKFRYGDNLHFKIDIDDSMLNTMVPKLCIQLLVENAIKFTTTSVSPPWHIQISCVQTASVWIVTVLDNGQGFPDDIIKNVTHKIMEIKKTDLLPSLELHGMGLMNVYIRLRLLYKDDCIFEFGNRAQGGAFVRIGGKINV
jgi:two-component system, sensor histidine kinase YesM